MLCSYILDFKFSRNNPVADKDIFISNLHMNDAVFLIKPKECGNSVLKGRTQNSMRIIKCVSCKMDETYSCLHSSSHPAAVNGHVFQKKSFGGPELQIGITISVQA